MDQNQFYIIIKLMELYYFFYYQRCIIRVYYFSDKKTDRVSFHPNSQH